MSADAEKYVNLDIPETMQANWPAASRINAAGMHAYATDIYGSMVTTTGVGAVHHVPVKEVNMSGLSPGTVVMPVASRNGKYVSLGKAEDESAGVMCVPNMPAGPKYTADSNGNITMSLHSLIPDDQRSAIGVAVHTTSLLSDVEKASTQAGGRVSFNVKSPEAKALTVAALNAAGVPYKNTKQAFSVTAEDHPDFLRKLKQAKQTDNPTQPVMLVVPTGTMPSSISGTVTFDRTNHDADSNVAVKFGAAHLGHHLAGTQRKTHMKEHKKKSKHDYMNDSESDDDDDEEDTSGHS